MYDIARRRRVREITSWDERLGEHTIPADPEVCPPDHVFANLPADVYAKVRQKEPRHYAEWAVTLACGHTQEEWVPMDWNPEDGPRHTLDDPGRRARFARRMLADPDMDEWDKRYLREGGPEPMPWAVCDKTSCRYPAQPLRDDWRAEAEAEPWCHATTWAHGEVPTCPNCHRTVAELGAEMPDPWKGSTTAWKGKPPRHLKPGRREWTRYGGWGDAEFHLSTGTGPMHKVERDGDRWELRRRTGSSLPATWGRAAIFSTWAEAQQHADEAAAIRPQRAPGDGLEVALQLIREHMTRLDPLDLGDSEYDRRHASLRAERDRIKREIEDDERAQLEQLASLAPDENDDEPSA